MDYIQRLRAFSNKEVNRAAAKLVTEPTNSETFRAAMGLVTDWRTLHEGPLLHFRPILEARVAELPNSLVVTRLKRIPTVIAKLKRRPTSMQLSTMQDIGGLRAVVNTIAEARVLADRMSDVPPQFELKTPIRDYISKPASSGYRGLHLVYTYRSQSDEDRNLDGLKIELQIRTRLQHVWATAVETVGAFRGESLKSGEGHPDWLELFRLAGELFVQLESTDAPIVATELVLLREKLDVSVRLSAYNVVQDTMPTSNLERGGYVLLTLDLGQHRITTNYFPPDYFQTAVLAQRAMEIFNINNPKIDTVMVSVDSLAELREAYPNYFADTGDFINLTYGHRPRESFYGAWALKSPRSQQQ